MSEMDNMCPPSPLAPRESSMAGQASRYVVPPDLAEKVAKALHEAHKPWCDYTYPFEHPQSSREVYEALATAALEVVDLRIAFVEACNVHLQEEVKRLTDGFWAARSNSDDYIRKNEVLRAENERLASAYRELAGVNAKLWSDLDAARIALGQIHTIAPAPTQAPYINPGKAVEDIARAALSVSDENRNGSDPEGLRSEGLPARCHEVTDALTLSPKEQKGSNNG